MRRQLFNIGAAGAAAMSLVLFIATCVAWVQSYSVQRLIAWYGEQRAIGVIWSQGNIGFAETSQVRRMPPGLSIESESPSPLTELIGGGVWEWAGFGLFAESDERMVTVPAWAMTAALAVLPTLWITRFARRRPRSPGHCPTCGYDCRATPRTCPECGTDLPSPTAATDEQQEATRQKSP